jgi:AcrR family transcriptional regulator
MLRLDSLARRDIITDVAMPIIATRGVSGVTYASLAARIGHSPQAIHQWVGTRDRMVELIAATFYQRWVPWTTSRSYDHAALAMLPGDDEEETGWCRVLLALQEEARRRPSVAPLLASLRRHEHELLADIHPELKSDDHRLQVLHALVAGLRETACSESEIGPTRARHLLALYCAEHAGPRAGWVSGACADEAVAGLIDVNQADEVPPSS